MRGLLRFLRETYYTPAFLLILCTVVIIIGFYNRRKFKYLNLLPAYALTSATQIIITFICLIYKIPTFRQINNYSIILFMMVEFIIFYNLLLQVIERKYLKKSMSLMQFIFVLLSLAVALTMKSTGSIPQIYYITDSIFLIVPCLFYFYEIFKAPPSFRLSTQPAFWIVIGFSFMIICSLPLNLLEGFFISNMKDIYEQINTLNYVFYSLVFVLILKAFLCKPTIIR